MAFFRKKIDSVGTAPDSPGFVMPTLVHSVPPRAAEQNAPAPSAEGLAIAQRLSGERTAVPSGFKVRADHFQMDGICVIRGELDAQSFANGKTEVAPGGALRGRFVGDELAVAGLLDGEGLVTRLTIRPGGEAHGCFRGSSLILSEGAILNGEYSRTS